MTTRYVVPGDIPEKSTWRYTATMKDDAGAAIPLASLTTLVLTLYVQDIAQTIINAVNSVDIKNTGRGTVGATDGSLIIKFGPSDNPVNDATLGSEVHVALIQGTYNAGADAFRHEVEFVVRNMSKVS